MTRGGGGAVGSGLDRRYAPGLGVGLAGMLALTVANLDRPAAVAAPLPVGATDPPTAEAERAVLRLPARYRADTSAYSSYLRGLTLRFRFRFVESRDTFAALVDRDPLYVPGLYGLAHAYAFTTLNDLTPPEEGWPRIDALGRRALALDSSAASAWLALAVRDMYDRRDLPRAGERLLRARLLDSLDPDVPGMRSVWLRFYGWRDSAVAEAKTARRLDPLSVYYGRLVGRQLFLARRYDEAREAFGRLLQDDAGWTRGYSDMALLYRAMGRPRDAVDWLRRTRAASGDSAGAALLATPASDSTAARLLTDDARRSIARLDSAARAGARIVPSDYAETYAELRDTVATLRWLDSMAARNDSYMHQIRLDPAFDFLRADPRYRRWERGLGLPELARSPR